MNNGSFLSSKRNLNNHGKNSHREHKAIAEVNWKAGDSSDDFDVFKE